MSDNEIIVPKVPKSYLDYPLHRVAAKAMIDFIVATETTKDVGVTYYTFRIYGRTMQREKEFVHAMRVELSRLRAKLRKNSIPFVKFSVQRTSCDQILDPDGNLLPKPELLITLARSKTRSSPEGKLNFEIIKKLIPKNDLKSKNYRELIQQLESQISVEIPCNDWERVVAAVWAVQNNYAVLKLKTETHYTLARY